MKKIFRFAPFAALAVPFSAFAQINTTYIKGYSDSIVGIINNILVPVLMAIAFIYFLYGVYKYFILGADSDTERKTGRQFVLWGIIGFVAILSVWGLVNIVGSTLGLSPGGNSPAVPTIGPSATTQNTNINTNTSGYFGL
ncbi:MAG: hypothetical protein WA058_00545 [Minisyncoccia bacterium]